MRHSIGLYALFASILCTHAETHTADIVVWGSTVCGVTAAVGAVRTNTSATVLWVVNATRLGGMTSGGLGGIDTGMEYGGLAWELLGPLNKNVEPHVAEEAVLAMLATAGDSVRVVRNTVGIKGVTASASGNSIASFRTESGDVFEGKVFIDCSYEGDLLMQSGTAHAVGREARSKYAESIAGDDYPDFAQLAEKPSFFQNDVSPFLDAANTTLLPTIVGRYDGSGGAADDQVMSYCFRMCLTNNATNRIAVAAPAGYNEAHLELLRRELVSEVAKGMNVTMDSLFLIRHLPNMKIDLNSGQWSATGKAGGFAPFSTDMPFLQKDYVTQTLAGRQRIFAEHVWWTRALLHFLSTDATLLKIQPHLVAEMASWGLCADEYPETNHWTPQLYVREGARLSGKRVMTQRNVRGMQNGPFEATSMGTSRWGVDVHAVQRLAAQINGTWRVVNAGGRDAGRLKNLPGSTQLTEIPYEALIPQDRDTTNLLVPVCASFSHIAIATYRLEPQYAVFGHSAGVAAAFAVKDKVSVQEVDIPAVQNVLAKWSPPQILHATQAPRDTVQMKACDASPEQTFGIQGETLTGGGRCVTVQGEEWGMADCVEGAADQRFAMLPTPGFADLVEVRSNATGKCAMGVEWALSSDACNSPAGTVWNVSGNVLRQHDEFGLCATWV